MILYDLGLVNHYTDGELGYHTQTHCSRFGGTDGALLDIITSSKHVISGVF